MTKQTVKNKTGQSGIVLFVALIALVIMSLAAVALIRSTDTAGAIAGNLAFQQSTVSSADFGGEAAMTQLTTIQDDGVNATLNVLTDAGHLLNQTNLVSRPGYHSSVCKIYNIGTDVCTFYNMTDDDTWNQAKNPGATVNLGSDANGNNVSYIIQRLCRIPNIEVNQAQCLTSESNPFKSTKVDEASDICEAAAGASCPKGATVAQYRITVRVNGPKNSVAYTQAFAY